MLPGKDTATKITDDRKTKNWSGFAVLFFSFFISQVQSNLMTYEGGKKH